LLFNTEERAHQVIQVTSPNPGDGKSTIAANLAISLATSNKRVVLVDCDFRKPRVHTLFALAKPELGLASVVADQADLGGVVQGCEIQNLSLLPCGPRPANPAELLTTPKFQEVLDELRENYDFVILDTPPVLAVSDPAAVAPRADGVLLVFRMTKDSRPAVTRATDDLTAVGGKLLGVIVNASTEREMGYGYGYTYRYDYQYSDSYADPK
jgi:capsular exopolysaccharide synthesis family protein